MFDPTVGRWFQEDPIGFDANDPNLYRYVKNSPTNATDPSGLAPIPNDPLARNQHQITGQYHEFLSINRQIDQIDGMRLLLQRLEASTSLGARGLCAIIDLNKYRAELIGKQADLRKLALEKAKSLEKLLVTQKELVEKYISQLRTLQPDKFDDEAANDLFKKIFQSSLEQEIRFYIFTNK